MPDSKNLKWTDTAGTDAKVEDESADAPISSAEAAANDSDGWQQYRHWISKAPAPQTRRTGIDPALYTWKGYRNWTDQVRRNWSAEHSDDSGDE